ncbi:hypothetical protein ACP4OV_016285 [Aristida adscensionis]
MQLDEQLDMENSSAKQESSGQFVRKVSSSGLVLKFKVDNYGTPSSNSTILPKAVRFNDKEIGPARLENCGPIEKDPSLQESEMIISNADSGNNTSFLDNIAIGPHPKEVNNKVDRSATMLPNAAADNSAKGVYETSSSEIAKLNNTGNIILAKGQQENPLAIAIDNGSGSFVTDKMHACHHCAKSFKTIEALNGHMGKHRREEYQLIRESLKKLASMEISETAAEVTPRSSYHQKETPEVREIWKASHALVNISREYEWQQMEHGAKAIDVLAGGKTSSHTDTSEYTEDMREVAEIMIEMKYPDNEDTVKMPSSPSLGGFMCITCNKTFDSYQSLQDHKLSHKKPKKIKAEDTAGSCNSSGKRHNLFKCKKCKKTFATGQSLGGHKRKHYWETERMKEAKKNVKPPVQPLEPAGLVDVKVQYASTELMVDDGTVHLPEPPAYDVQQPQEDGY